MEHQHLNGAAAGAGTPATVTTAVTQSPNNRPQGSTGFRRAQKLDAKGRVAIVGPSGSGKSYTMLTLARSLAGQQGTIACIDTEHGSLSKYADQFQFDADEPSSYTTEYLLSQLTCAEQSGYSVFCVDSLSHFWMGKDGALEYVDAAKRRARDQMEGWKAFRPHERTMVDRFIASPCHIIVTMRVKTDYEERIDSDGKKRRVKIGLAPVQREGLEYEFDFVGSMDDDNVLLVDKTRCSAYRNQSLRVSPPCPGAEYFSPFIKWLAGAQPAPRSATPTGRIDTGGHPHGTQAAADYVAKQKIAALHAEYDIPELPLKNVDIKVALRVVRETIGETRYFQEIHAAGLLGDPSQNPAYLKTREKAQDFYARLIRASRQQGVQ